ncbi:MAG: EAL domain-containing protein [Leptospiraceae bacterium]|nr:EAL domain-containing protein [Leptospiraceae bacterium]
MDEKFLYKQIIEKLAIELFVYNLDGKFTFINDAGESNSNKNSHLIGKTDLDWCYLMNVNQSIAISRREYLDAVVSMKKKVIFEEVILYMDTGMTRYYQQTLTPILSQEGNVICVLRQGFDITERIRVEKEFEHIANHDSLTGLPNRRFLYSSLKERFKNKYISGGVSIILMDLDRFKEINDTLGHLVGDTLIRSVATRISEIFTEREDSIVARIGGDEFVIALLGIESKEIAEEYAKRIVYSFREPFHLTEHELFITTSVGVYSLGPDEMDNPIDLIIEKADIAMYNAKESGRNRFKVFSLGMKNKTASIFALETKLYHALKNDEFFIEYQPKVDVVKKKIVSLESLIRWQPPNSPVQYPDKFIKVAENCGLLTLIGYETIAKAFKEMKERDEAGLVQVNLAINLSEKQFYDEMLVKNLSMYIEKTQINSSRVELEIKEQAIMKRMADSLIILHSLRDLGFKIVIDDFGSGSSSLGKLKNCPVDIISIDRSFIQNVTEDYQDAAITSAIISMAQRLGVKVSAEGIETKEQVLFLKYLRTDMLQGHYFSTALSQSEIISLLKKNPDYNQEFEEEVQEVEYRV